MIRSFAKTLALVLLASASFTACKKDKDDDTLAVTKENLAGTYTLSSIKVKVATEERDVTNDWVEACERDDEYQLKADLKFNYVDAGTECSSNGSYEYTWELNDKKIEFDEYSGTVDRLTSKELIIVESGEELGITFTRTYKFSKK